MLSLDLSRTGAHKTHADYIKVMKEQLGSRDLGGHVGGRHSSSVSHRASNCKAMLDKGGCSASDGQSSSSSCSSVLAEKSVISMAAGAAARAISSANTDMKGKKTAATIPNLKAEEGVCNMMPFFLGEKKA